MLNKEGHKQRDCRRSLGVENEMLKKKTKSIVGYTCTTEKKFGQGGHRKKIKEWRKQKRELRPDPDGDKRGKRGFQGNAKIGETRRSRAKEGDGRRTKW